MHSLDVLEVLVLGSWKAAGTVGFITSVCGDIDCVTRAVLSMRGVHDVWISYDQMLVLTSYGIDAYRKV